jgi:hypothetical protein
VVQLSNPRVRLIEIRNEERVRFGDRLAEHLDEHVADVVVRDAAGGEQKLHEALLRMRRSPSIADTAPAASARPE